MQGHGSAPSAAQGTLKSGSKGQGSPACGRPLGGDPKSAVSLLRSSNGGGLVFNISPEGQSIGVNGCCRALHRAVGCK